MKLPFAIRLTTAGPVRAEGCVFVTWAGADGPYVTNFGQFSKIQILTVAEVFSGKKPLIPLVDMSYFKKVLKEDTSQQGSLI
jgi:hypothetical protein